MADRLLPPLHPIPLKRSFRKHPERFGKGAIEGVAGPESANNAAVQSGFIPLLTLGIPTTPTFALFLAALLIHGIHTGPMLLTDHPDLFWGVIISMYLGNIMLVILNLPLIKMWVKILDIPYGLLAPLILAFCLIGSLAESSKTGDAFVMLIFGIIGYLMRKFEYEPAPMIIAFILTPVLELNFRQSMIISQREFQYLLYKPDFFGVLGHGGCALSVGRTPEKQDAEAETRCGGVVTRRKEMAERSDKKAEAAFFHPDLLEIPEKGLPYLKGYRCRQCGKIWFPKFARCPNPDCWSDELEVIPLSRRGRIYSATDVFIGQPSMRQYMPLSVGYVDLPEGIRIFAQLDGETRQLPV